ncbi:hypothetical protein NVP1121O_262 [Vibrio phage 1.121.O._10N.286.46.C4]|nr:hypothetical protein NVP1121O_262 [Vibrio phage 1.121.O._10N.286.46.C4]
MVDNIEGYPNYYWDGKEVWNIAKRIKLKVTTNRDKSLRVKLKNSSGKWQGVQIDTVKYLSEGFILPDGFLPIPDTEGLVFINPEGMILSIRRSRVGTYLKPYYGSHLDGTPKYPVVTITYEGRVRNIGVHQLMCVTFYDKDYVSKGLVCLHKDNDKTNFKLSNLKIGTYSENNKQAYDDGLNIGNFLGHN